jgi:E3 ubiquitin-protein ligase RNF5
VVKDEVNDDDLFGDDLFAGHEVVDLVDREEMPPELREEKKPKNYVKLSAFNCVICMDDVTDLTVTHCGHLFCSACLHSALHIDVTKRVCPICRQKIDNRPSNGKWSSRAKGYYPLELKLMTKTTLGKRAASS